MLVIPTPPLRWQILRVVLAQQAVRLSIAQRTTGLFMDVYVNDALIIGGVICQNANRIVRSAYLGFIGDLAFFDTQGTADPVYTGLGGRFILFYIDP